MNKSRFIKYLNPFSAADVSLSLLWAGKEVLVSPKWIDRISWSERKAFINLSREVIKQSPEYTEESLLTRDYESALHRHYNRKGYWVDEPVVKEHSS